MCGRFALGIDATELREALGREYFGRRRHEQDEPQHEGAGPRDDGTPPLPSSTGTTGNESSLFERARAQQGQRDDDDDERDADESSRAESRGGLEWRSTEEQSAWRPRYNVAPKSGGVVVRRTSNKAAFAYELSVLKWGLVPHWTKSPQEDPPSTINAQMESVFEGRPTWKVRDSKRCIVVAQGFYEWVTKGKDKVPHFIKRADGKLMIFAGLWDHCEYKGNFGPVTSYTIITTPVNKQLRQIHSRMPAILESQSDIEVWLSARSFDDKVRALVKPFAGKLEFYPVDKGVGAVRNDSRDFIKPVSQKAGSLDTFFAKQASTPSKQKSDRVKAEDEVTMNPDEDTKVKTEQLVKIEKERNGDDGEIMGTPSGKGKKREVETLELSSSDEDEGEDKQPATEPKKRKVVKKEENSDVATDGHGNGKLDGFFTHLD